MLTATQHQRIDRYLAELAGALGDLPEAERDDVAGGIREHIQAALADRPAVTDADVDEVLRALGDPLAVAAAATGDAGPATPEPRRDVPVLQRDWIPGAVVAALLLGPAVLMFLVSVGGILLMPFMLVVGWVLLWASPLWSVGEKLAGTFLMPAAGIVFFAFTFLASGRTEVCVSDDGGPAGTYSETCTTEGGVLSPLAAWVVLGLVAALSIATAVVVYRNGRRRSAELGQIFSTGA